MSLAELTALISPPVAPNLVGSPAEWRAVEEILGITFPADFREFVFTYGDGQLGRFYSVWNPFEEGFIDHVQLICGYERESQKQFPEYFPYAIYPVSPGFLPWGSDDNGNYYGWFTEGSPDGWPVLTNNIRGRGYRLFEGTMTEYLVGVFRGEVKPLAGGYPESEDLVFECWGGT